MKKTTLALSAFALLSAASQAAITTIAATGWSSDIVINNGGGPYNTTVNGTMDNGPGGFDNWTFAEEGTYPVGGDNTPTFVSGLTTGTHTSATGSQFVFQSFDSDNALLLPGSASGLLTLAAGGSYSTLALFGSTSGGPTSASVTVMFSDLTSSVYTIANQTGIGRDWFNYTPAELGYAVGARLSNRGEDGYTNVHYQENSNISIHESLITLSAADQAKTITAISITNTGGGNLAVMALSGQAVPEPSSICLLGVFGLLGMVRRKRG
ncbi:PEP-CTERM sorting domain-containing protein [Luteolibacter marinus]|uniref:PEP-CTERM sorting domain-containing protein n=1 Tax=Luteolibacter marinus TaxID=2776705 RepID=UPI001866FD9A|nr:PEP-CTERM sorting domain-containing protein [Luteolibacter marinus]